MLRTSLQRKLAVSLLTIVSTCHHCNCHYHYHFFIFVNNNCKIPSVAPLRPAEAGLHWYWADTARLQRRRTAAPSIVITRWCCGCCCGGVTTPVSSAVAVLCVSTARVLTAPGALFLEHSNWFGLSKVLLGCSPNTHYR